MLHAGILDKDVKPPATPEFHKLIEINYIDFFFKLRLLPISLAAIGAPTNTDKFGAMNVIRLST